MPLTYPKAKGGAVATIDRISAAEYGGAVSRRASELIAGGGRHTELWHLLPHLMYANEVANRIRLSGYVADSHIMTIVHSLQDSLTADDADLADQLAAHVDGYWSPLDLQAPDEPEQRFELADRALERFNPSAELAHWIGRPIPERTNRSKWFDLESKRAMVDDQITKGRILGHLGRLAGSNRYQGAVDYLTAAQSSAAWYGHGVEAAFRSLRSSEAPSPLQQADAIEGTADLLSLLGDILTSPDANPHDRDMAYFDFLALTDRLQPLADPALRRNLEQWNSRFRNVDQYAGPVAPQLREAQELFVPDRDGTTFQVVLSGVRDSVWRKVAAAHDALSSLNDRPSIVAFPAVRDVWRLTIVALREGELEHTSSKLAAAAQVLHNQGDLPVHIQAALLGDLLADTAVSNLRPHPTRDPLSAKAALDGVAQVCRDFARAGIASNDDRWHTAVGSVDAVSRCSEKGANDPEWIQRLNIAKEVLLQVSAEVIHEERFKRVRMLRGKLGRLQENADVAQIAPLASEIADLLELSGKADSSSLTAEIVGVAMTAISRTGGAGESPVEGALQAALEHGDDGSPSQQAMVHAAAALRQHYGIQPTQRIL